LSDITEIKIGKEKIGTIHFGDRGNPNDTKKVHINIQPMFWKSKYRIEELTWDKNGHVYVYLSKEKK